MSAARWAVYYAPPADHPLWAAGCRWLGRDPETGEHYEPPADAPSDWGRLTDAPRRYGFHATLKPPFRLTEGVTEETLRRRVAALAAQRRRFQLPRLAVGTLGRFLALRPTEPAPAIAALAVDCVRLLDDLRAPPSEDELARRHKRGLTGRQSSLLARWGYPYVMEEFRFHTTLTGSLDTTAAADLTPSLTDRFAPALREPVPVEGLALFHQPGPGKVLRLVERFGFGG